MKGLKGDCMVKIKVIFEISVSESRKTAKSEEINDIEKEAQTAAEASKEFAETVLSNFKSNNDIIT